MRMRASMIAPIQVVWGLLYAWAFYKGFYKGRCPNLKIFSAYLSVLCVSPVNLPAKAINRRETEGRRDRRVE